MSAAENTADKLKELPHMTEEHLATLRKHGLTTPERLLEALDNPPKWAAIHAELKGIGPKTADIWRLFLESGQWAKPADKPAHVEKATEAPKPQPQAVRVARQVKTPAEAKVAPAVPKPEPVAKKIEPVREPVMMRGKAPEKVAAEKPKVKEKVEAKVAPAVPKPEPVEKEIEPVREPVPVNEKALEKAAPAKPKAKATKKGEPKAKAKKEPEGKEEVLEVVEEGGYMPSKKPKLSPEVVDALKKRSKVAETRPEFTRQEYGRRLRLQQTGWRKPRGIHSKARYKMRYRRPMVSIGYGGPKLTKNYHPSGFREVHVFNVADLAKISDADKQAARIGHGVGRRKRELMIKKADELGIRVLNRR